LCVVVAINWRRHQLHKYCTITQLFLAYKNTKWPQFKLCSWMSSTRARSWCHNCFNPTLISFFSLCKQHNKKFVVLTTIIILRKPVSFQLRNPVTYYFNYIISLILIRNKYSKMKLNKWSADKNSKENAIDFAVWLWWLKPRMFYYVACIMRKD